MQHALRPFLTGGLAVAGAAMVTIAPVAQQLPEVQHQAVELTSAAAVAGDAASLGFMVVNDGTVGLFPIGPMADMVGIGHMTLSQIVDFLGLGGDKLNTLLPGLVDGLGLGKATLGGLVGDLGLSNAGLAGLLNGLVDGLGLDKTTLGSLVDGLGLGDENVGTLVGGLVNGLGLGGTSLDQLVDGLGLGDMKLSAMAPILTDLGNAVPGLNSVTFGDVVGGLGLGGVGLGTILKDLGGSSDFMNVVGNALTVNQLLGLAGLKDAAVFPGLATLLADPHAGLANVDVSSALDSLGLGRATLDQLLGALPLNMSVDSLLSGLNLDNATLGDLLGSGLIPSGATVGGLLDSLGLSDTSLDTLIAGLNNSGLSLLNDSLDDLLKSTGVGAATIDGLLNGLGLYDHALITIGTAGSSAAELPDLFGMEMPGLHELF